MIINTRNCTRNSRQRQSSSQSPPVSSMRRLSLKYTICLSITKRQSQQKNLVFRHWMPLPPKWWAIIEIKTAKNIQPIGYISSGRSLTNRRFTCSCPYRSFHNSKSVDSRTLCCTIDGFWGSEIAKVSDGIRGRNSAFQVLESSKIFSYKQKNFCNTWT